MKKLIIGVILASMLTMCVLAVTPGINVLTGTKDALNFDGVSGIDYFTYGNPEYSQYMTYSIVNDPTGSGRGKMFCAKADLSAIESDKGSDTYIYYQLKKALGTSLDRPAQLLFETHGSGLIGFWLNAVNNKHLGTLTSSWQKIMANDGGSIISSPNELKIQYATRKNGCTDVQYIDNLAIYPYYKIDYVASYPDGSCGATTTRYYFDAENLTVSKNGTVTGFPTSYSPESVKASFPGYDFLGWTDVKDGKTVKSSISLSGKDITLYPVWEKKTTVLPVNVTVYLDENKTQKITEVCSAGYEFKLPAYATLTQYTKAGKMPTGFRMNGTLYAPGKSVILPEEDNVVFVAEYADTLHETYGELVALENFDSVESGTYICDGTQSNPINASYINPSWSANKDHFQIRYGDSMGNSLQVVELDGNNVLKFTKINASSMWPQLYVFNNGGTPDGLYTVTADFIIPKSEISHLTNINIRIYYSGKELTNVQKTISSLSGGDKGITVASSVAVSGGSDITGIPKIQIFATADATEYNTSFYIDNLSVYRKKASADVKLSDEKTWKIFFTPGEEITLPYSYEILDTIPEGYVLSGFKCGDKMYSEGTKYTTKDTDSSLTFEAVYKEKTYALKFETASANGTIGEIEILDGEKVTLPEKGLYHSSLTLKGWKIKAGDKEYNPGAEFEFSASDMKKYLDGTDRLVFVPVFNYVDAASYFFGETFTLPATGSGNATYADLVRFADSLYYGVRRRSSPCGTDKEKLSDMASKGVVPKDADLTKQVTYSDAADMLANVLPEAFYNELCFDVNIDDAENKKLVRAGIFDESVDFSKKITVSELKTAAEKLCDKSKRSVENKRTFVVLGDSLTEAYGPSNPTKGWPEFIENYLTGNIAVANYGIAGINTGTYFNASHERASDYYNKMITSVRPGDYVVIALGTNDSTLWGWGDMTKQQSRENYYRLISEIRAQGGIPMLVGPVGRNETDENGNYKESDPEIIPVMQSVNELYGVNVPIIDFKEISFDALSEMTPAERGEFYIDSVHYRAKGADIVAGWFRDLVCENSDISLDAFRNHFVQNEKEEYITLDIGAQKNADNVRFVQINGARFPVEKTATEYAVSVGSGNMLVEVIEKANEKDTLAVNTSYYFVDAFALTYTKLDKENFVYNSEEKSIRVEKPEGLRFMANFSKAFKKQTKDVVVKEYGFILTREDFLQKGEELTFGFDRKVSGVAYNREDNTDKVFDGTGEGIDVFAGVLTNIPEEHYKTNIVCKTYTVLSVGDDEFTVYGEKMTASMYEIAKAILESADADSLTTQQRRALNLIVSLSERNDIGLDGDKLFD